MMQSKAGNITEHRLPVLGITGGIGSGKSEVIRSLSSQPEFVVIESDRLAHRLMEPGNTAWEKVISAFGTGILDENGMIDRAKLGAMVFGDPVKLGQLNNAVHPCVKEYILEDIIRASDEKKKLYVIEAALLVQDGYREICDAIWTVYVPKEVRISRLLSSRGGSREKWESVFQSQPEDEWFRKNTDLCIANTGTKEELISKVEEGLKTFFDISFP